MSTVIASPNFTAYIDAIPEGSNHLEIAAKCDAVIREMMSRMDMGTDTPLFETRIKETYIMWVYSPEYETKLASMEVYKVFLEKAYGFQFPQDTEAVMPDVLDLKFKFGMNPLYKISPEVSTKMRDYTAFLTESYNQLLTLYATGIKWHMENSKPEVTLKYHWLFRFYCAPIYQLFQLFESSMMTTNTIERNHREYSEQREIYQKFEVVEMTRFASRMSSITCLCCPILLVGTMIAAATQCFWAPLVAKNKMSRSTKTESGLAKIIW